MAEHLPQWLWVVGALVGGAVALAIFVAVFYCVFAVCGNLIDRFTDLLR